MLRRLPPVLVVTAFLLAACSGTPALSDPREIVTSGFDATAELKSFHVSLALDGSFSMPDSGGTFSLTGTTFEADVDLDGKLVGATFAVPALLGLSGELRMIDTDLYFKTSLTGTMWSHMGGDAAPSASPAPDVSSMIDELRAFLDKEGVETVKLDDVDCGERKCYHIELTIPAELMNEAGPDASMMPSMDPSEFFGEALVLDLLFDREKSWLTEVSTSVTSDSMGTFNATFTFSAFDEPVTVTAPPADEVTEGTDLDFPF
ncbi:MAG: hypothetical protein ABIQ05_04925 [Candidatus Limnocylindria bacterium]